MLHTVENLKSLPKLLCQVYLIKRNQNNPKLEHFLVKWLLENIMVSATSHFMLYFFVCLLLFFVSDTDTDLVL